jgi:subtilisin family serine protease
MCRYFRGLAVLVAVLTGTAFLSAVPVFAGTVDGQYLVMMKGKGIPASFEADVVKLGGEVRYSHEMGFAWVSGLSAQAARTLGQKKYVGRLEADESFALEQPTAGEASITGAAIPESPSDPTTAFFYARQWNMRAIEADDAWAAGRLGSPGVTVAILDTGIDYEYPDLAGLVDLGRSISFVPVDDFYVDLYFPGKHPITDIGYHGTHVASTVVSNGNVIAGVTSATTLMGVKVCGVASGVCEFGAVISGILWAADNGADVANMSLGGGFSKAGNGGLVGFINSVFNYANNVGMTIVVSAGNDAIDLDHDGNFYKTYCSTPNTICVSATGPTSSLSTTGPWTDVDAFAPYSNYGRSAINVAAPGGTGTNDASNPGGWVYAACSQTSLLIPVCQTGTYIVGLNGTSMAAPHVTGLAALLVEDFGRRPGRIKTMIQQTADDLGQRGTDPYYGKGRINVGAAVGY